MSNALVVPFMTSSVIDAMTSACLAMASDRTSAVTSTNEWFNVYGQLINDNDITTTFSVTAIAVKSGILRMLVIA